MSCCVKELFCDIESFIQTTLLHGKQLTQNPYVRLNSVISLFVLGQQWTDDNKVGKLVDGHTDFEGNGVFSKLLLDVSLVYVNLILYLDRVYEFSHGYICGWPLECTLSIIYFPLVLQIKFAIQTVVISQY